MLQGELLRPEQHRPFDRSICTGSIGGVLDFTFAAEPAGWDIDSESSGRFLQHGTNMGPIQRKREGCAEGATLAIGLGKGSEGASLTIDRGFTRASARRARNRSGGDGEASEEASLRGESVTARDEPLPGCGIDSSTRRVIDDARLAPMECGEKVDGVGEIPKRLAAPAQGFAREIGMGPTAMFGNAG